MEHDRKEKQSRYKCATSTARDSDYTVYDNKIFYGIHDENKINLYYFDMQNNMERNFIHMLAKMQLKIVLSVLNLIMKICMCQIAW